MSLFATTYGEMLDSSASPLVKYNPGEQAPDSPLDAGSSNSNYLKRLFCSQTGASSENRLMPTINSLDIEALSGFSNSLCPAAKVEGFKDFLPSGIGNLLSNTQGEQSNSSNNVEYEEPADIGALINLKTNYYSSAAQQADETAATKKARASKISSRIYRAKIAEALKALKNALPHSESALSQTRLNGEASVHSFVHIEGFGHYLLHPHTYHQPLEEMVGHLLNSNPQVVNELLEHKGLAIVPMDFAYALLQISLDRRSNSCP